MIEATDYADMRQRSTCTVSSRRPAKRLWEEIKQANAAEPPQFGCAG